MNNYWVLLTTVALLVLLSISASEAFSSSKKVCTTYITAASLAKGSLDSVKPYPVNCAGVACEFLLSPASCLGAAGPLGAFGPLALLGPIGDNSWSPSTLVSSVGSWEDISSLLTLNGGPLSAAGPLGEKGPLGASYYTVMPKISDFARHLAAHGLWTVLGPVGPLGALGPLGPLGPIGAHGLERGDEGDYIDTRNNNTEIVTSVTLPFSSTASRQHDLFELYTGSRAAELSAEWALDTSFSVETSLAMWGSTVSYQFVSDEPSQYVTLLIVPDAAADNFDLILTDENNNEIARSDTYTYVDFIQVYLPRPAKLKAVVQITNSAALFMGVHPFRLFVVGSTQYIKPVVPSFTGDYIVDC